MKNKETIIEIEEDIKLPGTNVMLEKGDKIQVLQEATRFDQAEELVNMLGLQGAWEAIVNALSDAEFNENYEFIMRMNL